MPAQITKTPARKIRARKSYEERSGMTKRASVILATALVVKPAFGEDENGNRIRAWKASELLHWTFAELASCLCNRVAVEANEMLGTVPAGAIKYSVNKGWLVANKNRSLYQVTLKGAIELDLPLRFKGGRFHGRKIPFLITSAPAAKPVK